MTDSLIRITAEEIGNFLDVEEALQDRVHVACITRAPESLCFFILETSQRTLHRLIKIALTV